MKLFTLLLLPAALFAAEERPTWFQADYKSGSEWGFYCRGDGKTEDAALTTARSQCAQKMCQLFGVEVDSQVTTTETLKSVSVESKVIERCPNVRIVGRTEKKKSVACEDDQCIAFVFQRYPRTEYDIEYKRLNQPPIAKTLEKTIVIRENDRTFRDPAPCRQKLKAYSMAQGELPAMVVLRTASLADALSACRELDYRDTNLQEELRGYLVKGFQYRPSSVALALNARYQDHAKLEEKVEAFLAYETSLGTSTEASRKLSKRLQEHYDALWARDNYLENEQVWVDSKGRKSKTNPYLEELKTCTAIRAVVNEWPEAVGGDLRVCVPAVKRTGEDCSSFSLLFARAQFAGCLCRTQAPGHEQDCSRVLYQQLLSSCAGKTAKKCFPAALKATNEQLSISLH